MQDRAWSQLSWWHLGLAGALSAGALVALVLRPHDAPSRPAVALGSDALGAAEAAPAPDDSDDEAVKPFDKFGDPEPAEAADDIPVTSVPCIDDSSMLTTDGKAAIICWGEQCRVFDGAHGTTDAVPTPTPPDPPEELPSVSDEHGAFEICTGERCTRVGPRLAAALTAARAAGVDAQGTALDPRTMGSAQDDEDGIPSALFDASATRDHRVVSFHGPDVRSPRPRFGAQAWDVARDRLLVLHPPPSYPTGGLLVAAEPIGDLLLASWGDPLRPHSRAIVVDRDGRNRGLEFEAGELVQQTRDRFVVLGELGAVTVIDHGRATAAGLAASGPATGVRIDDHRIAASTKEDGGYRLFTLEDGKARTLETLPVCP